MYLVIGKKKVTDLEVESLYSGTSHEMAVKALTEQSGYELTELFNAQPLQRYYYEDKAGPEPEPDPIEGTAKKKSKAKK